VSGACVKLRAAAASTSAGHEQLAPDVPGTGGRLSMPGSSVRTTNWLRVSDRDSSKRADLVTRPHRQRISETTAAAAAATATLGVLSQLQRRQQLTDHILMMPLSFAPRDR